MDTLLRVGEAWLIISAMASTFYIMVGMQITDREKVSKQLFVPVKQIGSRN
jgi:hypothetical protein